MKPSIIALIFDFDITLSPAFQQQVIFDAWGVKAEDFWAQCRVFEQHGYDQEHAYMRNFIDYGKQNERYRLSNAQLYEMGKHIKLYDGLSRTNNNTSIFDDIHHLLQQEQYTDHTIKLECYCISGGLKPMIEGAFEAHNLTSYFKEVYACEFDEDDTGKLAYIKETVGHTIKTQKLFMIGKGVSAKNGDAPDLVNAVYPHYRIPFSQMVFLGDGQTDIPAFSLLNRYGGTSIAVYREEKRSDGSIDEASTLATYQKGYDLAIKSNRAQQLLPADYSAGKALKMALLGEVKKIADIIVGAD